MAKVLLVEDDNNLREIYQARLMAEGYDIVSAMNGEEALVVAKQEQPDLVISDVMMPRISGFEMLDIMRNTTGLKDFKVIMLTALGQAEDKTRANSLGADRYLVKSQVTLEDIVTAAHELLNDLEPEPVEDLIAAPEPAPAPVAAAPVAQPEPVAVPEPVYAPEPVAQPVYAPQPPAQPEPVAQPVNVPQPQQTFEQPVVTPQPPVQPDIAGAVSAQNEESIIQTQIQNFVNAPTEQPIVLSSVVSSNDVTPLNPPSVPQPPAEPQPVIATPEDAVMAKALENLGEDVTTAPQPQQIFEQSVVTPQPPVQPVPVQAQQPAAEENDSVTVSHKKIISPIGGEDISKLGLNELMAKEGLDLAGPPRAIVGNPAPTQNPATNVVVSPPGQVINPTAGVDPNSIAL